MTVEKIVVRFDEDNLTLGDLVDFEAAAGLELFEALKPVPTFDDEGERVRDEQGRPVMEVKLSAKSLKALVWVVLRADRPGFSLDDARNIRVTALEMVGSDETPEGNDDGEQSPATVSA